MDDRYDLGAFIAVSDPYFVEPVEDLDGEDRDEGDLNDRAAVDEPALGVAGRRILGMGRDALYTRKAVPGHRHVAPGGDITDDALLASIDRVALHSALRLGGLGRSEVDTFAQPMARKALLSTARSIGVAPWRLPSPTLDMLLHDLSKEASPAYRALMPEDIEVAIRHVELALKALDGVLHLPGSTQIEPIFAPETWLKLNGAVVAAGAPEDAMVIGTGLRIVEKRALAMIAAARQSRSFSVALNEARQGAALSIEQLAAATGIPVNKLRHWAHGETPRKDATEAARRLEEALNLPPATLRVLLGGEPGSRPSDEVLTDRWKRYFKAAGVPLGILPDDWAELSRPDRKRILAWINTVLVHGSPYRQYQRCIMQAMRESNQKSLHKPLPAAIALPFESIKVFKTIRVPDERFDRRSPVREGRRRKVHGGRWRLTTTAELVEKELSRLVTHFEAMGNERDALTLGALISAKALREATEAIAEQRYEHLSKAGVFERFDLKPHADRRFYVQGDINRLLILRGLFNASTGYLYHHKPDFTVLQAADGRALIDAAFIELAEKNWPALVAREWEEIGRYADDLADEVAALRDPSFGIQPILDLESPYQALIDARDRMEDDRPPYLGSPIAAARHDRDHCLIALTIAACPRRRNVGPLTYRKDQLGQDVGHLRRNATTNHFELHIPKAELKNEHSRALPPGDTLVIVLDPGDTRLYRSIERWVVGEGCSRDVLHGNAAADQLFPGQNGGGICDHMMASIIYKFSARYLIKTPWRDTGFVGVLPFGPHAIRDIVATHVLRTTGSLEAAAAAIYDTIETVEKRYAHLAARDRGIRNIINIRLGLRPSEDPMRDRLLVLAEPLKLGSAIV